MGLRTRTVGISRCSACRTTLAWVDMVGWRGLGSLGCLKRFGGHLAMDDPPGPCAEGLGESDRVWSAGE